MARDIGELLAIYPPRLGGLIKIASETGNRGLLTELLEVWDERWTKCRAK